MAPYPGADFSRMKIVRLKSEARALARKLRQQAHESALRGPKGRIADALMQNFLAAITLPRGAVVSGYWPVRGEIDVIPLLAHLHGGGHVCGLPVMVGRGRPLSFREWRPGLAMEKAGFGVPCPGPECREVTPDLLLVPLLAFDAAGYRLGYGGGYYDRTLSRLRKDKDGGILAVGVAYAAQQRDHVPRHEDDQPLDWMVTEKGVFRSPPAGKAA